MAHNHSRLVPIALVACLSVFALIARDSSKKQATRKKETVMTTTGMEKPQEKRMQRKQEDTKMIKEKKNKRNQSTRKKEGVEQEKKSKVEKQKKNKRNKQSNQQTV